MDFLEEKKVTALVWATSAFHLVANSGVLEKKGSLPPAYRHSGWRGPSGQAAQPLAGRPCQRCSTPTCTAPRKSLWTVPGTPIQREFADGERIPIGRACANKEVFLLDEHLQPVPPRTAGGALRPGHRSGQRDILASGTRPGRLLFRTPATPTTPILSTEPATWR